MGAFHSLEAKPDLSTFLCRSTVGPISDHRIDPVEPEANERHGFLVRIDTEFGSWLIHF